MCFEAVPSLHPAIHTTKAASCVLSSPSASDDAPNAKLTSHENELFTTIYVYHDLSERMMQFVVRDDEPLGGMMDEYSAAVQATDSNISNVVFLWGQTILEEDHTGQELEFDEQEEVIAHHVTHLEQEKIDRRAAIRKAWNDIVDNLQTTHPVSNPSRNEYSVSFNGDGIFIKCAVPGCGQAVKVNGSWHNAVYVPNVCNWNRHWFLHNLEHMLIQVVFLLFDPCAPFVTLVNISLVTVTINCTESGGGQSRRNGLGRTDRSWHGAPRKHEGCQAHHIHCFCQQHHRDYLHH